MLFFAKKEIFNWGHIWNHRWKAIKGMKYMKLTLSIKDLSKIMWWMDVSNRTHKDCKGHTGVMMSLDGGAVISS